MGKTGSLPRKERAGSGGGSRVAAEEHGGRGRSERAQERGGKRAPTARMRAPSFSSSQAWASDRGCADGADVGRGGARRPLPTPLGPKFRCASLEVAGRHLFLQWGFRELWKGEHVPLPCSFRSPPPRRMGGRSWACQGESAPGFPAHFNSVSTSTARRFTPPGAPEPSAGTRSPPPHSFPLECRVGAPTSFP